MGKLSQEEIKAAFEASGIESKITSMGSQEILIGKLTKQDWLIVQQKESIPSELSARLEHIHDGITATWQQVDDVSLPLMIRHAQDLLGIKPEIKPEVKSDIRPDIRQNNRLSKGWIAAIVTIFIALAGTSYAVMTKVNQCTIQQPVRR